MKSISLASYQATFNAIDSTCESPMSIDHSNMRRLTALAVSSDGRYLATASFDATVRLWDYTAHKLWLCVDHRAKPLRVYYTQSVPTALSFIPSGDKPKSKSSLTSENLMIGLADGTVLYADMISGKTLSALRLEENSDSANGMQTFPVEFVTLPEELQGSSTVHWAHTCRYTRDSSNMLHAIDLQSSRFHSQINLELVCAKHLSSLGQGEAMDFHIVHVSIESETALCAIVASSDPIEHHSLQWHRLTVPLTQKSATSRIVALQEAPYLDIAVQNVFNSFLNTQSSSQKNPKQSISLLCFHGASERSEIKQVTLDALLSAKVNLSDIKEKFYTALQQSLKSHNLDGDDTALMETKVKKSKKKAISQEEETDAELLDLQVQVEKLQHVKQAWLSYIETLK